MERQNEDGSYPSDSKAWVNINLNVAGGAFGLCALAGLILFLSS